MADNTQIFKWTGVDRFGKRVGGSIRANDIKAAQKELRKIDIEVITLKATRGLTFSLRRKTVKRKDIVLFTRHLSTMLGAGLPILQSLDVISRDQENIVMQSVVTTLKSDIAGGKTLAESFRQFPEYFNPLYCNLIQAGEKSGTLDKTIQRLAHYLEKSESLKNKIKKAMVYPIAIISVGLLVSSILLFFVVPQFATMFASFGAQLPFFTQLVIDLSNFLVRFWWLIIIVLGLIIWAFRYSIKNSPGMQNFIDKWSLKIPIIGNVLRKGIIARFSRTLATTLAAGMPIIESMRAMAPVMGNRLYTKAVNNICDSVGSGHQMSVSLTNTKLFPNMVIQMVAIGEASGTLEAMLNKLADYYEEEVDTVVENLSNLIEPVIMVILGVIVGGFVIAMYLPIFKLGSLF